MSLPLALKTTIETIPADVPYLYPDAAQVRFWQERLAAHKNQGRRIGVAWAGNPRPHILAAAAIGRRRSIAPDRLAPLFKSPGLHFLGLQKDGPAAPVHFPLTDFMAEMGDFADTAALIANLDLVISVDTSVVHLRRRWASRFGWWIASIRVGAGSSDGATARGIRAFAYIVSRNPATGARSWPRSPATYSALPWLIADRGTIHWRRLPVRGNGLRRAGLR